MSKTTIFSNSVKKERLSEEALIKKSIKGDSYSFEVLLLRYKGYLYKIAFSYTKNECDSLDLIQECSYKAWLNIKSLKKHSSFKLWISKILVNTALNSYCKQSKINYIDIDDSIPDQDVNLSVEEKIDLQNAIDLLKPEYKTVIMLKYFDDMTIDNIAEVMELSPNTVKTYLRRAKSCIKKILKEDY